MVRLATALGKIDKAIEAHEGATICARWNKEGTAFATGGEDGSVKVWSSAGLLRGTLHKGSKPVYTVAWSPDDGSLLFSQGGWVVIKPQQPGAGKQAHWKAHNGTVTCADWSAVTGLIVTGGEDCKCRVWDGEGRNIATANPTSQVVTTVAWRHDGEQFGIGTFEEVRVCDKAGWTRARASAAGMGSIFKLAWRPDGTKIACATGNGGVATADVFGQRSTVGGLEVEQDDPCRLRVHEVVNGTSDVLEFRERVVTWSLLEGSLIVATPTQCFIYGGGYWSTPHMVSLKATPRVLIQSRNNFLLADSESGSNVYSKEGKHLCKLGGGQHSLRADAMSSRLVSLSQDAAAMIDATDTRRVLLYDVSQAQQMKARVDHTLEVVEIGLSQGNGTRSRKLAMIDRNRDLYVAHIHGGKPHPVKLASMADSFSWHGRTHMLAALADQRFICFYHPDVATVDKELLPLAKEEQPSIGLGRFPSILAFSSSLCVIRRHDGTVVTLGISQYAERLHELHDNFQWAKACRLCRFCRDKGMWACLAAMALVAMELETAEAAYAALGEVDKLRYIRHVKSIQSPEGKSAAIALFRRQKKEAESTLIQAGLVYRAIRMNIDLFEWRRALDLAIQQKTHVDTVLYHRAKHLERLQSTESDQRFKECNEQVGYDEDTVHKKAEQEEEKEARRTKDPSHRSAHSSFP